MILSKLFTIIRLENIDMKIIKVLMTQLIQNTNKIELH